MAANLGYFYYRISRTINYDALAFSLVFLAAEVHGFVSLWLYFFDLWDPTGPPDPPPPPENISIDVFIPTYNEDTSLLHRTILAAKEMRLPHRTCVLDDGDRPEVRRLAEDLGVDYISRPHREHAKAGNINYALARTNGELVVIFDADHVPAPNFLERTVGYFRDPRVGFVQTPHVFYNFGSFQTAADFRARKYWDDQQLFFRLIQPGKNRWGAAFFCGSCGVIRRKCLEEIGGFDYRTITEDMHTSLRIQDRGWKSVYHDERLATGLSPGDLGAYWKQRMRWAVGNLSTLWYDNPLFKRGLSLAQRISYFSSIWAWTVGPQKLVFYLTPPLMLFTGLFPMAHFDYRLLTIYAANLVFSLFVYKIVSRGYGRILRGELYSMINAFMLTAAMVRAALGLRTRRFVVTRKGGRSEHVLTYVLPQAALVFITYWSALWAFLRYYYNLAMNMTLTTVAGAWSVYNAALAVTAARVAYRRIDVRGRFRFLHRLPVTYGVQDVTGAERNGIGMTLDLHDGGMALRTIEPIPVGAALAITLHLPGGDTVWWEGKVLHRRPRRGGQSANDYGIACTRISPDDRARLDRFIIRYVIPAMFARLSPVPIRRRRWLARLLGPGHSRRRFPRRGVQVLMSLSETADEWRDNWFVTEDLSEGGLSFLSAAPVDAGEETPFTLLTPEGKITGRAQFVRAERCTVGEVPMYRYALAFLDVSPDARRRLRALDKYAFEEEAPD